MEMYKAGTIPLSTALELLSDPGANVPKATPTGNGETNKRPHEETGEDSESEDEQKLVDTIDSASSGFDAHLFLKTSVSKMFPGFAPTV